MLERRAITRDTVAVVLGLSVRPDQTHLVSSNLWTLAEAPYETGARVWGLWYRETAIGLMAMVHPAEFLWHDEGDDLQAAYLWRLMIDARFQGNGYGRAALREAVAVAREWGLPRLVTSVANVPDSNIGFYERFGFRRTGRIVEGENVITLDV